MPCGGIYPISGSWVKNYIQRMDPLKCFHCDKPDSDHFCDEWDCYLHEECIDEFLKGPEGQIVVKHKHEVIKASELTNDPEVQG